MIQLCFTFCFQLNHNPISFPLMGIKLKKKNNSINKNNFKIIKFKNKHWLPLGQEGVQMPVSLRFFIYRLELSEHYVSNVVISHTFCNTYYYSRNPPPPTHTDRLFPVFLSIVIKFFFFLFVYKTILKTRTASSRCLFLVLVCVADVYSRLEAYGHFSFTMSSS